MKETPKVAVRCVAETRMGKRGAFTEKPYTITNTIGAFIIRIGFWDPFYYNKNKEPPQNSIGNFVGP